jgi:hypothetical protein
MPKNQNNDLCCNGMRRAVALNAVALLEGHPEAVTPETEKPRQHFLFNHCPFCAANLNDGSRLFSLDGAVPVPTDGRSDMEAIEDAYRAQVFS